MAVLVGLLGLLGFTLHQRAAGLVEPLATRVYRTLQLFVLESGAVDGAVPWQLDVARFAAPLVAGYAVLQTLAAVFREQVESLRLHAAHDHVVVAGLGAEGRRLAEALLRRGERVVVIEADGANPALDAVRAQGGLAVRGDARSPETQRRAGADRATHLVALCGDDATNAEVVATARADADARRDGTLTCIAHVVDPDLAMLLSGEELERYGRAPVRMDFVNVHEAAAHALLRTHPADEAGVAVIGSGPTALHLLLALARTRAGARPGAAAPLPVTVLASDALAVREWQQHHAELGRFVDLRPVADADELARAGTPGIVYVCQDDDGTSTATALALRGRLDGPTRVVVALERTEGIGRLLEDAPHRDGGPTLTTFGLLDASCQPEVLLSGTTELLAQALHRTYLEAYATRGAADPALQPWDRLPDTLRESNRDQAAHVAVKLAAVGRTLGPILDWDEAVRPFDDDEVEHMARLEHDRWVAERRRGGWREGPRDARRRTTPYLVGWEDLSEEVRDADRLFVRRLPALLASIGLQAHRRDASARTRQPRPADRAVP